MELDSNLIQLGVSLAEVAVKNTAQTVYNKISTVKAKKDDKETINSLTEIINELLADKNELINISKCYEDELVAQKISDEDITYITEKLVPLLVGFVQEPTQLAAINTLLSMETLKVLQLLGFNYKRAIGEPLTELVSELIKSQTKKLSNASSSKTLPNKR